MGQTVLIVEKGVLYCIDVEPPRTIGFNNAGEAVWSDTGKRVTPSVDFHDDEHDEK